MIKLRHVLRPACFPNLTIGAKRLLSFFDEPYLRARINTNFTALSPVSLIKHAASVHPDQLCYVSGAGVVPANDEIKRSWRDVYKRVLLVAARLRDAPFFIQKNDVISVISPNTHVMFELHYAVPGIRAVLHTINSRLDPKTIAFQLQHAESKLIFVDTEFGTLMEQVLALLPPEKRPVVVDISDSTAPQNSWVPCGGGKIYYESLAADNDPTSPPPPLLLPENEWDAIALNYTSGTTGNPKGVVTHHRGAYLNAIQNLVTGGGGGGRFLWIVPLFHCNGWSYVWSIAVNAGTSYFLRTVRAEPLIHIINTYKINKFCGAPITMLTMLTHHEKFPQEKVAHDVSFITAGAPPPPSLIDKFQTAFGISVQTAYGLTESYGPISSGSKNSSTQVENSCTWQSKGSMLEEMAVVHSETGNPVAQDGKTVGEIVLRGNILMKGYYKNETATESDFRNGWYFTGDIGVWHHGSRVEIKDRSKDVIISGGENVASGEVENILLTHPEVREASVVAMSDPRWGEVPAAFIVLKNPACKIAPQELMAWARTKMAGFQTPKAIIMLAELPKTSTGKVQKHALRDKLPQLRK